MSRVFGRYGRASAQFLRRHSTPVLRTPSKPQPKPQLNGSAEVTPYITRDEYASRRAAVMAAMPSHSLAIFPSAEPLFMSEDVPHLYHQNTDLLYLTGCVEPGAILMLDTTPECGLQGRSTLFVEPRNPEREKWDGPMHGVEKATRRHFGVDEVLSTGDLAGFVARKLGTSPENDAELRTRVFLDPNTNREAVFLLGKCAQPDARTRLLSAWARDSRPKEFVSRARLIKSPAEMDLLRRACSAISGGLNDAMAHCVLSSEDDPFTRTRRGTVPERAIEAHIEFGSKMRGATRMAFPSVVASGTNGTILHYMSNDRSAETGDFVMVDAGCQVHGLCSDVSRSWPVSGKFSGPQRALYELVLDVQLRCIDMAREGGKHQGRKVSLNTIHAFATEELTRGLLSLGFMRGMSFEEALSKGAYSRWFSHSIGHYLGYDVHDTHSLSKDIALEAGMCITIEPGLYIRADDDSAPEQYRGIGMRVEDDVLVRNGGSPPEVLSHEAVKQITDIEALVGSGDGSVAGGLMAPKSRIAGGEPGNVEPTAASV